MRASNYIRSLFGLSLAGTLFAGFLTYNSMILRRCVFGETCPTFLGYPTCVYGFAMFLSMFLIAAAALAKQLDASTANKATLWISALGILFAGSFTLKEIPPIVSGAAHYTLGLPTCAYGLVFYIIIFSLSVIAKKKGLA